MQNSSYTSLKDKREKKKQRDNNKMYTQNCSLHMTKKKKQRKLDQTYQNIYLTCPLLNHIISVVNLH